MPNVGKCLACGECCKLLVFPAGLWDDDNDRLLRAKREYVREIRYRGRSFHLMHLECKHLMADGKCEIYAAGRPQLCHDFPLHDDAPGFWKMLIPRCGFWK